MQHALCDWAWATQVINCFMCWVTKRDVRVDSSAIKAEFVVFGAQFQQTMKAAMENQRSHAFHCNNRAWKEANINQKGWRTGLVLRGSPRTCFQESWVPKGTTLNVNVVAHGHISSQGVRKGAIIMMVFDKTMTSATRVDSSTSAQRQQVALVHAVWQDETSFATC